MNPRALLNAITNAGATARPSLSVEGENILELPPHIGNIPWEWLDFGNNNLSVVPPELGKVNTLTLLNLSRNRFTAVPQSVCELSNLRVLDLSANHIASLPSEIRNLSGLTWLSLAKNDLEVLPAEIGNLRNLEELDISSNKIRIIPDELGQLEKLRTLKLSYNNISSLPPSLSNLQNLRVVQVDNNPLVSPPAEMVEKGWRTISIFLRNLQASMVRRYEAKFLLLGEGGVGKSSLLRGLLGLGFDSNLFTTKGVDVARIILPHPTEPNIEMQINVWDFAGQEIEHATHQFFMSPRSLYALTWNARYGDIQGRLDYWLERIQSHAPKSPTLLVATHVDVRNPDVNFPAYQKKYPELIRECHVDNSTGKGIEELKQCISQYAALLPQMGQMWPQSWQEIERELKSIEHHHISFNDFTELCHKYNLTQNTDINTLIETLHNLGIVMHFNDDSTLRDLVVLKPNWITKAISYALTDQKVRSANGCLDHRELPRIWNHYDEHLYPAFFKLMNKFELCYQIEGMENQSLIPALLPYSQTSAANISPSLKMVYNLSSVPAGLMSRFIVRTHRFTKNTHWRDGVILEFDGQKAVAELSEHERKFSISLMGSNPTNFFALLTDTANQILSSYPGLKVEREVPCNCSNDNVNNPCDYMFKYEELSRYAEKGKASIDCRNTLNSVNVFSLLYGIHATTQSQVIEKVQNLVIPETSVERPEAERQIVLLGQRGVIQEINRLESVDTRCPVLFLLSENADKLNLNVFLVCQSSQGWHLTSDTPTYSLPNNMLTRQVLAPLIREIQPLIQHIVPLPGLDVRLSSTVDVERHKFLRECSELMKNIVETTSFEDGRVPSIQSSMRDLFFLLERHDENHVYGGLRMTTAPDGSRLWLCPFHYSQLQPQPLSIHRELPFDAFLCHNSKDKEFVSELGERLSQSAIKCWIDKEQILGGDSWQQAMDKGLQDSACTVVCIGENSWGNWQWEELQIALMQGVGENKRRVIPLLIPPLDKLPDDCLRFLKTKHALVLRDIEDTEGFDLLVRSIKASP